VLRREVPSKIRALVRAGRLPARLAALAGTLLLALAGCPEPDAPRRPPPEPPVEPAPRPTPAEVWVPLEPTSGARYAVRPPFAPDPDYASDAPIDAHEIVYRFETRVPAILGAGVHAAPRSSTELRLLVTPDRLRAHFVGPGWPVHPDSEVRVREDRPGAYVFDGDGGRPLGPGQMAQWFEGGPPLRHVRVWLRIDELPGQEEIGKMVCRFLAEWSSGSVDALTHQCERGVPRWIRLGPFTADRTADVPLTVPRRTMRADHEDPPARIQRPASLLYHSRATYQRMRPRPRPPMRVEQEATPPDVRGLRVHNAGRTRMIVTLDGTPLGWVEPDATVDFPDVPEGLFMVGGLRPLGGLAAPARAVRLPGVVSMP
jgi:hypothetical protein